MTGFLRKSVGSLTGAESAAGAALAGAETQAEAQREALEYLKEREAIPQQFREEALGTLGGLYGLGGGAEGAIDTLRQSPIYESILASRGAGEEAILRQAAATGGLRSGNVQGALADYNIGLEQQALQQSLQGIQGLAQLPSYAPQIASGIAGIGQTQGQGIIGAAQTKQAGIGQGFNILTGLLQGAASGGAF